MSKPIERASVALAWLGCASLGLPLLVYGYLGLFSRYAADDYCTAGQLVQNGLLGMQAELYRGWSGRFSFTFFVGLAELIGSSAVMVLPMLALVAWVAASMWLVVRLPAVVGGWPPLLAAALLSLAVVYATLSSTPDLGQSLLWQTGVLTYVAPLILMTALAGLVVDRVRAGRAGWFSAGYGRGVSARGWRNVRNVGGGRAGRARRRTRRGGRVFARQVCVARRCRSFWLPCWAR